MSLWSPLGTKPKNLSEAEKKLVYATASGWVLEAGAESARFTGNNNPDAQPEVLVAIGQLADRMSSATITEIELITPLAGGTFDKSNGGNISVRVRFDEEVTVTGTPHFIVNNKTNAARHQTCLFVSGSGSNELVFTKTLGAASADINAGDELNVIANPIAQNGGSTIKDKGTTTNSDITSSTAIGTAAGEFTCVA
tara:strand:- start:60 stop:647 length:588 start_codon:yes stop_codon:yes gene_type:complete